MQLDPKTTAVLTLDFQKGIIGMCEGGAGPAVAAAAKVADHARGKGFHLIHVGLGFEAGYPEIPDDQPIFGQIKKTGRFLKGTESAEFDLSVMRPGELVVAKQRVGAFSENQLDMILRAKHVKSLVLFGLTTSGIVLSTLRRAFDLDYHCIVIKDACYDHDAEVHRVLTDKIFARQASVVTAADFIGGQK